MYMWSSENERAGFKKCSPFGYFLVETSSFLFAGVIISLFVAVAIILRDSFSSGFSFRLLGFLLLPISCASASFICDWVAWFLVRRKALFMITRRTDALGARTNESVAHF